MAKEEVLKIEYHPPFELEAHILGPTGEVIVPWRVPPCWADLLYELLRNTRRWKCFKSSTGGWEAVAILRVV